MSGKLFDPRYRRTASCTKYVKIVKDKSAAIPEFDDAPIDGKLLTEEYIRINGLNKPLMIKDGRKDLHMRMLDSKIKLSEIATMLGPNTPIKVIEVGAQEELESWTFGEYADFFEGRGNGKDHKILNLISLEISSSPLATKVQGPSFVRQLDWIDAFWPSARRARGDFPRVQKYLLAGMQGAYTDFHLDFGGTSVWYHIVWGEKIFYFIRPTGSNLLVFEKWSNDSLQSQQFLPDLLPPGECVKVHLRQGDTMLIPGGWIHAVYTPMDSLVFGGNFIHSTSIVKQLQVYGIEDRTRVGKKYRFPFFKQLMWLAVTGLLPLTRAERDGGDMSNDNDPLYELYLGLAQPHIMKQWVYLIKMCELWLSEDLAKDDKIAFSAASVEAGCASNSDVLTEWYQLLNARISTADSTDAGALALKAVLDRVGGSAPTTKGLLLSLCQSPSLDEDCLMPLLKRAVSAASPDAVHVHNGSITVHTSPVKVESTAELTRTTPSVKTEGIDTEGDGKNTPLENAGTTTTTAAAAAAPGSASGLRLKFKVGGSDVHKASPAVVAVDGDGDSKAAADGGSSKGMGVGMGLHIQIQDNPEVDENSLFGSEGEEEGVSPSPVESQSLQTKKSFKFRLKESSTNDSGESAVGASEAGAVAEVKTNLAFRVPRRAKKVKATEVIEEDTLGKERYGTRGLRLSAKFLENAADFVDDDDYFDEEYDTTYTVDTTSAAAPSADTTSATTAAATTAAATTAATTADSSALDGVGNGLPGVVSADGAALGAKPTSTDCADGRVPTATQAADGGGGDGGVVSSSVATTCAAAAVPVKKASGRASGSQKRGRGDDGDFMFDVHDAADEEEYNGSDGPDDNDNDDDWVADVDDEDPDYIVDEDEESSSKKRNFGGGSKPKEERTVKKAAAAPAPTPPTRLTIGGGATAGRGGKAKGPPIGMSTGGTTGKSALSIRQQLMKKLGQKYK
jgi:hypothetical protein